MTLLESIEEIREHNAKNLSWKLGITELSDRTQEEYLAMLIPADQMPNVTERGHYEPSANLESLPNSFDWRDRHMVTKVIFASQNN